MKKWLLILLAMCICCATASAEISVEVKAVTEARSLEMNPYANTFVLQDSENRQYRVADADLNPLSEAYPRIDVRDGLYKIYNKNSKCGLLDGQGRAMIPVAYDDIKVISSQWAAGIVLKAATSDNYDYETIFSDTKKFYLIDTVDIYLLSEKKATLSRQEWHDANAFGDYLIIQDRDRKCIGYNKDFVKSTAEPDTYFHEYTEDYRAHTITHMGSGQQAFVPECTLTPEEVQQYRWVNNEHQLIDLQGNVIADLSEYYSHTVNSTTNLVKVRNNNKKEGLLDSEGKVLIPCIYDSLDYELDWAVKTGYLYAVRDGKGGFVSLRDGSETGFGFIESAGNHRSSFIIVEDPREGVILISAAAGELPGRYKSVDVPYTSAAMFATAEDTDGRIHVIDAWGNEALSDHPEVKYSSNVSFSKDGSMIMVRDTENIYHIYTAEYSDEPAASAQAETEEPAEAAEEDDTWTCENGHTGNTGNFCPECGAPRPVQEDGTWTCSNGHGRNTGNFCTECGAAKPEE